MGAHKTPLQLEKDADTILANGNGHLAKKEPHPVISTERFYEHPRENVHISTPNGSVILVISIDGWLEHDKFGMVLIAHGVVKKSDNCPELVGDHIAFAVDADYAFSLIRESI